MSQPNPKNLKLGSEALHSLFENGKSPLSQQFIRWKLWRKWEEYVGPTIAQVSEPVGYVRGGLYVWVKSSVWMQQMVFMRETMKDTINDKLGFNFIKNIYLTLDRKSAPRDAEEAKALKEAIKRIENSEPEPEIDIF